MRARILEDSYFATAPAPTIITEELGDIDNEVTIDIGKIGCCIVLLTPFAEVKANDVLEVIPKIAVFEDVTVNRSASGTNKPADEIALKLMANFLGWRPPIEIWTPFRNPAMRLVGTKPELNYELSMATSVMITAQ